MTLLAEDLLLLLLDDVTGKPLIDGTRLDRALAGAVLLELALAERVGEPPSGQRFGRNRIVLTGSGPIGDPLLEEAVRRLSTQPPPGAARAVEKLVKGTRQALLARIVEAGYVREEHRTILGIFPGTRWPALRPEHEEAVRRRLHAALIEGQDPDQRTAALVSLLMAVDAVPKVVTAQDRRALVRRARTVADGEWAGEAVRKAVAAVQAALTASLVAVTATMTAST